MNKTKDTISVLVDLSQAKIGEKYLYATSALHSDFCIRKVDKREETGAEFLEFLESIRKHGVLYPIWVYVLDGKMQVYNGEHRRHACAMLNIQYIPVEIVPVPKNEIDSVVFQVNSNISRRRKITDYKALIKKLASEKKSIKEIAIACDGMSIKSVYEILSLVECPEVEELFNKGASWKNILVFSKNVAFLKKQPKEILQKFMADSYILENKDFSKNVNFLVSASIQKGLNGKPVSEPAYQVNQERLKIFIDGASKKESKYNSVFLFLTGQAESL